MNLELENKTALVTGSTAGIGLAIAANLAREGATVIINGRTKKRVNDAIKLILSQYSNAKLEPLVHRLAYNDDGINHHLRCELFCFWQVAQSNARECSGGSAI
jgi:NAD(P)-dependent dehydrogenase (short-subunit alcohol dehydrogenase family)